MPPPMYTAVRIVKMYACRKATSSSNPVRKSSIRKGSGMNTAYQSVTQRAAVRTAKVTSRMWPASRLAKSRSEEHTSELQSRQYLVCRLLLEKKKTIEHK